MAEVTFISAQPAPPDLKWKWFYPSYTQVILIIKPTRKKRQKKKNYKTAIQKWEEKMSSITSNPPTMSYAQMGDQVWIKSGAMKIFKL